MCCILVYRLASEQPRHWDWLKLDLMSGRLKMKKKQVMIKGEIDKRIIEKKIMGGEISEKELENFLKELPDLANYAEEIVIE